MNPLDFQHISTYHPTIKIKQKPCQNEGKAHGIKGGSSISRNLKIKVKCSWFLLLLILFQIPIFSKLNSIILIFISSKEAHVNLHWGPLKFRPKTINKNKLSSSQISPSILLQFEALWSLILICDSCRFLVVKNQIFILRFEGNFGWCWVCKEATTSHLWRVVLVFRSSWFSKLLVSEFFPSYDLYLIWWDDPKTTFS